MASEQVSLSSLSIDGEKTVVNHSVDGKGMHGHKRHYGGKGLIWSLILFIFFWFIVFIIIVAWAPKWLRKKGLDGDDDGERRSKRSRKCLDYGKAFLWALVIAIIAVLLFWLLSGITAGFLRCAMRRS